MSITLANSLFFLLSFFFLYRLAVWRVQLSYQILLSLILGIIGGIFLKFCSPNSFFYVLKDVLRFTGEGYLALLKMLVIPLVLISIIHATLNLGHGNQFKKIAFGSSALLLGLTAVASLIGMLVGLLFGVGKGLTLPLINEGPKHVYTGLTDTVLSMLPNNLIENMLNQNMIAIVIFAILVGIATRSLDPLEDKKISTFRDIISALFAIIKKLTTIVLSLTPFGILGLMSLLILDQGFELLSGVLNFVVAMYVAMFLVLLLHLVILSIFGFNPWQYLKKASPALFVAFTTRSSFGALPVTEKVLAEKFSVTPAVSSFVPSLGATMGMNACAGIFPAMLVVMTMTILNHPITWDFVLLVMCINTIASLGISGIPGTAYIAATVTLTTLNLPYAIVALVQGIDPLVDMGRTATNVNGVMTTALVVNAKVNKH